MTVDKIVVVGVEKTWKSSLLGTWLREQYEGELKNNEIFLNPIFL